MNAGKGYGPFLRIRVFKPFLKNVRKRRRKVYYGRQKRLL